jgi:pyrroline-5-carboxylate reductase
MKIGFIGAGKMARALASGLVRAGIVDAVEITCSSRSEESGRAFLGQFPGEQPRWTSDNTELVRGNDLIVVSVKPQQFAEVLPPLREASAGKLFLSLAAGVTLARIAAWLHPAARVVRAMPNMPMQIGLGASVYARAENSRRRRPGMAGGGEPDRRRHGVVRQRPRLRFSFH